MKETICGLSRAEYFSSVKEELELDEKGKLSLMRLCPKCNKPIGENLFCKHCNTQLKIGDKKYRLYEASFYRNNRDDVEYDQRKLKEYDSFKSAYEDFMVNIDDYKKKLGFNGFETIFYKIA